MIDLNIDLTYLMNRFEISTQRVNQYSNKNINELMEAEAANGNQKAAGYVSTLKDPEEVARIFDLSNAQNRYLIIKNLSTDDLMELLKYLNNEDLIWGLKYLSLDKLMELTSQLPQDELLKMVLNKFPLEKIINMMSEDELNNFMKNSSIEKNDIVKFFEQLKEKDLQELMAQVMGNQAMLQSKEELIKMVQNMEDNEFNNMLLQFNANGKKSIIYGLVQNNNKFLKFFEPKTLVKPFSLEEKSELLQELEKLDQKFLMPMLEELPESLLQVIATQIDPQTFAKVLTKDFADILKQISL